MGSPYLCAGYRKSRDFCGQTHSIRTVILEKSILENLRETVSFASRSKDEFVRLVMDSDLRQRDRDLAKRKRQLADSESGSQSWMLSSSGSMRTTFRASSPMNAFRSSLRTMRRKNGISRC